MSSPKHASLVGQDLTKLVPGRSVLKIDTGGDLHVFDRVMRGGLNIVTTRQRGHAERVCDRCRFTYIGERDADGWITAPEGGWMENPVPGMRVDWRCDRIDGFYGTHLSDDVIWPGHAPIVAFRPAPVPDAQKPPAGEVERLRAMFIHAAAALESVLAGRPVRDADEIIQSAKAAALEAIR